MNLIKHTLWAAAIVPAIAASQPVFAQSNVSPTNKHAWGENIGWTNWRDANATAQGAVIGATFLSGYVWGENVGWINLGDGAPTNGVNYANTDGADSGVNVLANGDLDGLAWGENIGWVNFGTTPFVAAEGARIFGGRLLGYAWGENVGWINLDTPTAGQFVGLNCAADLNNDGFVNASDLATLLGLWGSSNWLADLNGDGVVNAADLAVMLGNWGVCP